MSKSYTSKSNATRAAAAFADKVTGFKAKVVEALDADDGFNASVTFETTEERFIMRDDNKALLDEYEDRIVVNFVPRERSTVAKPCALVWDIADRIVKGEGGTRKQVIDAAVAEGVNKYTARTQYQRWYEAVNA